MSTKELQDKLVKNMRDWQKIEDATVMQTSNIIVKTSNETIRKVMEIIRGDSQRHYRVQEFIINTLQTETVAVSPDDLKDIWEMVQKHIELEKKTIGLATEALSALEGKKMVVQEYMINYLLDDEKKHEKLLEKLELLKKGMYTS